MCVCVFVIDNHSASTTASVFHAPRATVASERALHACTIAAVTHARRALQVS